MRGHDLSQLNYSTVSFDRLLVVSQLKTASRPC